MQQSPRSRVLMRAVLALLFVSGFSFSAQMQRADAAEAGTRPVSSASLNTVDAPGHHFGFSQASVLAQATSATETAVAAQQTQVAAPPPGTTGTGACAAVPGQICTITGNASGTFTKVASGTITVTALAPPTAIVNDGAPILFVPTTTGVELVTNCTSPAFAGATVSCVGSTIGDPLIGATVSVRFVVIGGFQDVTGTVTAVQVTLTQQAAITQAQGTPGFTGGQAGVPCAAQIGESCSATGGVIGSGNVSGSMRWNLTATVPVGAAAVGAGTPFAVFTTTNGIEALACAAVVAGATVATCAVTTVGNALLGSSVVVVFPGVAGAAGPAVNGLITGPGNGLFPGAFLPGGLPFLPPPPPPPPPPLLPPPPLPPVISQPASVLPPIVMPSSLAIPASAAGASIPLIPEADSILLVVAGLAALGGVARYRAWRGQRP